MELRRGPLSLGSFEYHTLNGTVNCRCDAFTFLWVRIVRGVYIEQPCHARVARSLQKGSWTFSGDSSTTSIIYTRKRLKVVPVDKTKSVNESRNQKCHRRTVARLQTGTRKPSAFRLLAYIAHFNSCEIACTRCQADSTGGSFTVRRLLNDKESTLHAQYTIVLREEILLPSLLRCFCIYFLSTARPI